MNILDVFLDILFPPREDELVVRGLSQETLAGLVEPKPVTGSDPIATALLPFHDSRVRASIHEAKYHGSSKAFDLLGEVLGEYLVELNAEEALGKAVLVPIPLSRERRSARGYNQAEEVARRAARRGGLALKTDLLMRLRDTPSQTSLARFERHENMRGAFLCPSKLEERSRGCAYILIDDVTTTGATLDSAASALRAAGVRHVIAIALAH